MREDVKPTPVEVFTGMPLGVHKEEEALPEVPDGLTPRGALEEVALEAVKRPPCLVSFSGGRDSSAVLALAAAVARREGLPLPVPTTYRFPGVSEADEKNWQELVVRHLDLEDWRRTEVTDELELIGPEATAVLRRHGVLLPLNAYSHAPFLREAAGGSLLTGFDGDGLFAAWRWHRAARIRSRRTRPRPRDVLSVALASAPRRMRIAWVFRRTGPGPLPWLRPHVERACRRAWAAEVAGAPARWDRRVEWFARRRPLVLTRLSLSLLAEDAGTRLLHPLADPRFLATVARDGGRSGASTRTDWMRSLFADLLPERVLLRSDKADVGAAHWGERTRRFAEEWDGSGVDDSLVRVEVLREAWKTKAWLSATLLQVAWLSSLGGGIGGSPAPMDLAGRP
jgi:asparagine synthetase B (glutamine-hydrolysing)